MSGLPPSAGAVQDTVAAWLLAVAETSVGADGAVGAVGVTAAEAEESGPVPTAFVALTRNVYAVPMVRPVTVTIVPGGEPLTVVGV